MTAARRGKRGRQRGGIARARHSAEGTRAQRFEGQDLSRRRLLLRRELYERAATIATLHASLGTEDARDEAFMQHGPLMHQITEVGVALAYLPWAPSRQELDGRAETCRTGLHIAFVRTPTAMSQNQVRKAVLDATRDSQRIWWHFQQHPEKMANLIAAAMDEQGRSLDPASDMPSAAGGGEGTQIP